MDTRRNLDLSKYRFERAEAVLKTSEENFISGDTNSSANRSYYAIFYGMLAVTLLDGFSASKHSSIISYFRRTYIKTKIFDDKISDIIGNAFNVRTEADYGEFYIVSIEEAQEQIDNARFFLDTIRPYLENCWQEIEQKYAGKI